MTGLYTDVILCRTGLKVLFGVCSGDCKYAWLSASAFECTPFYQRTSILGTISVL
eukprot:jgi/Antlo1/1175/1081